jgi:hypothetical protein
MNNPIKKIRNLLFGSGNNKNASLNVNNHESKKNEHAGASLKFTSFKTNQNSEDKENNHEKTQGIDRYSEALVNFNKEIQENNSIMEVYNLVILDESGSMANIRDEIIGVLRFIYDNLNQISSKKTNLKSYFSFLSFYNKKIKYHEWNIPVDEKMKMKYSYLPYGSTNLLDACCESILRLENELSQKENFNVFVTIITDGEENSSVNYTPEQTSRLIERLKKTGKWHFMYVGADHDVENVSKKLHISEYMSFKKSETGLNNMKVNVVNKLSDLYDVLDIKDFENEKFLRNKQ